MTYLRYIYSGSFLFLSAKALARYDRKISSRVSRFNNNLLHRIISLTKIRKLVMMGLK